MAFCKSVRIVSRKVHSVSYFSNFHVMISVGSGSKLKTHSPKKAIMSQAVFPRIDILRHGIDRLFVSIFLEDVEDVFEAILNQLNEVSSSDDASTIAPHGILGLSERYDSTEDLRQLSFNAVLVHGTDQESQEKNIILVLEYAADGVEPHITIRKPEDGEAAAAEDEEERILAAIALVQSSQSMQVDAHFQLDGNAWFPLPTIVSAGPEKAGEVSIRGIRGQWSGLEEDPKSFSYQLETLSGRILGSVRFRQRIDLSPDITNLALETSNRLIALLVTPKAEELQ